GSLAGLAARPSHRQKAHHQRPHRTTDRSPRSEFHFASLFSVLPEHPSSRQPNRLGFAVFAPALCCRTASLPMISLFRLDTIHSADFRRNPPSELNPHSLEAKRAQRRRALRTARFQPTWAA